MAYGKNRGRIFQCHSSFNMSLTPPHVSRFSPSVGCSVVSSVTAAVIAAVLLLHVRARGNFSFHRISQLPVFAERF